MLQEVPQTGGKWYEKETWNFKNKEQWKWQLCGQNTTDYSFLGHFYKIYIMIKSKNDNTVWWGFQCMCV